MALASEDIWANVDMNSSDNIDLLLDCVAENSGLRLARYLRSKEVLLGDPEVTANIYCKSRNLPNTDRQKYSTDLR